MNELDPKSVLVGVDGSRAAVSAAKWAIDEAISRQLPIRLVYVIRRTGAATTFKPASDWELERGDMVIAQAEGAVQGEKRLVEVETVIHLGDPAEILIDESRNAALVCVGTARRGWGADGLMGPTATALVARAHCPVAVIRTDRDGSPTDVGVIAVVLNDEPDNDEVVHLAMEEGRRRRAIVRQIDRRVNSWIRRYPDVPVQTVAAGTGPRGSENHSSAVDLAVVGEADAAELPGLVTPNCHPILGYPDCSVLLVRH